MERGGRKKTAAQWPNELCRLCRRGDEGTAQARGGAISGSCQAPDLRTPKSAAPENPKRCAFFHPRNQGVVPVPGTSNPQVPMSPPQKRNSGSDMIGGTYIGMKSFKASEAESPTTPKSKQLPPFQGLRSSSLVSYPTKLSSSFSVQERVKFCPPRHLWAHRVSAALCEELAALKRTNKEVGVKAWARAFCL